MDLFRRTGSAEVFEALARLCKTRLLNRVRVRSRALGRQIDADELVQDAFINIYRYPDRFDASRPGAFNAWSSTIVDNAVRRHLQQAHGGPEIRLQSVEELEQEPDSRCPDPGQVAMESEALEHAGVVVRIFLAAYLHVFGTLGERERFVLQRIEVDRMPYAEVASLLGVRRDALKMIVFRARRRLFDRMFVLLPQQCAPPVTAKVLRRPARALAG